MGKERGEGAEQGESLCFICPETGEKKERGRVSLGKCKNTESASKENGSWVRPGGKG